MTEFKVILNKSVIFDLVILFSLVYFPFLKRGQLLILVRIILCCDLPINLFIPLFSCWRLVVAVLVSGWWYPLCLLCLGSGCHLSVVVSRLSGGF